MSITSRMQLVNLSQWLASELKIVVSGHTTSQVFVEFNRVIGLKAYSLFRSVIIIEGERKKRF